MDFLTYFFEKFNKPSIQFLRVFDEKRYLQEIFEKIFKKFLKKITENALF